MFLRITIITFQDNPRQFKEVLKISNEDVASHVANESLRKLRHPRHSSNCLILYVSSFVRLKTGCPWKFYFFVSFLIFVTCVRREEEVFEPWARSYFHYQENFKLTDFVMELTVLPRFLYKFRTTLYTIGHCDFVVFCVRNNSIPYLLVYNSRSTNMENVVCVSHKAIRSRVTTLTPHVSNGRVAFPKGANNLSIRNSTLC